MTTQKRPKRVEAWAVIFPADPVPTFWESAALAHSDAESIDPPLEVVHLIESDPRIEAELKSLRRLARAAKRTLETRTASFEYLLAAQGALKKAVEAHTRLMAKKR